MDQSIQNVPLLDVNRDNAPILNEIHEAISAVTESGWFIGGPACKELEKNIAEYSGAEFAIGCASGSDALLLPLLAHEIGPGDEVIVPSFTFFASVSAITRLGATPVFIDIEHDSFNLNPELIEELITENTKAIIPVHLFGQCANMTEILPIAEAHNLFVLEDAAQAIGASHQNHGAGSMGNAAAFSFYPTKNLGGLGDGGMVTCNDEQLAERIRCLANHGMKPRYYHQMVGVNSRLDSYQAAGLNVKLKYLDEWTKNRQINAQRYEKLFLDAELQSLIELPEDDWQGNHVWNQYTIRIKDDSRDTIREQMKEMGVGTEVYYPVPVHAQECYQHLQVSDESLPVTMRAAQQVLALPIFPGLTEAEQVRVVHCLATALNSQASTLRKAS